MKKYELQFEVTVVVQKTIRADSLEEAMQAGKAIALTCPIDAKLVKVGPGVTYAWNNETKLTGVFG